MYTFIAMVKVKQFVCYELDSTKIATLKKVLSFYFLFGYNIVKKLSNRFI